MNFRIVRAIALKDLRMVRQNPGAWVPVLVVPVIFVIVLPLLMIMVPQLMPAQAMSNLNSPQFVQLLAKLPPEVGTLLHGLTPLQIYLVFMVGLLLAPMFLILPLMLSSIIGADAFAGEKERKTMEALVYTPASDQELFAGKVAAAVLPAIAVAWLSFGVYTVVVNVASWPVMQRVWFPLPAWYPLMFWVTPALAVLAMGFTVVVSARARTFMEAYQLGGALVLVAVALLGGQVTGVLFLDVPRSLGVGLVAWIVALALLRFASRTFRRETLLYGSER